MKIIKYAPLHERWESSIGIQDYRNEADFPLVSCLYDRYEDAKRDADNNRGNYPYTTTGRVVMVEVTMKVIK